MLSYVVDEPREQEINEWNRNMAGTLFYLKLANELGGWPSTVTTMADSENGIDYLPILEAEDVVQPHPGERDAKSVAYAKKGRKVHPLLQRQRLQTLPLRFLHLVAEARGLLAVALQFLELRVESHMGGPRRLHHVPLPRRAARDPRLRARRAGHL